MATSQARRSFGAASALDEPASSSAFDQFDHRARIDPHVGAQVLLDRSVTRTEHVSSANSAG